MRSRANVNSTGNAPWYPSDVNLVNDLSVMRMMDQLQLEGYGIYHIILGWLCSQPNYSGTLEQAKFLAKRMGASEAKFLAVINGYDLFRFEGERFFSLYLDEKMLPYERRKEAGRKAVNQRWKKQKELPINSNSYTTVLPALYDRNTEEIRGEKKRRDKRRKDNKKGERRQASDFEEFWILYDKKVGDKVKLEKKWSSLSKQEKEAAMHYIPKYKESQPDKKFRKNPETFLNNKSWNDEIIPAMTTEISSTMRPAADIYRELYGDK